MRKKKKTELKQTFLQSIKKKKGKNHLLNKELNAKQTESEIE